MNLFARVPFSLACGVVAVSVAHADNRYLHSGSGPTVRTVDGACWLTGAWTDTAAHAPDPECDSPSADGTPTAGRIAFVIAPVQIQPVPEPIHKPVREPIVVIEHAVVATDALFDFDQIELRPRGMQRLDLLASHLTSASHVQWVRVVGHADRLGSTRHNQDLSERRAQAVTAYLISQGVASQSILAEGRGESEPVQSAEVCTQRPPSLSLIACLEPDRRVEVEAAIHVQRDADTPF